MSSLFKLNSNDKILIQGVPAIVSLLKYLIMNPSLTPEIQEVIDALHYRPAVSIIMPFEPKIGLNDELTHSLKAAADKVEKELLKHYRDEIGMLVMLKLRNIIKNLNFNYRKKSIAIYVSPLFEKVVYLDIPVEEKIIIDESFEIRDLLYSKKQLHKYLVLLLSGKESRIYLGNAESLIRIASDTPESVYAYLNDLPERVSNFSDISERKEIVANKFLKHIDNSLDVVLNAYPIPLFVLGTEKILGHFKKLTKHEKLIRGYVKGNYEEATLPKLKDILRPYITDWKKMKERELLQKLDAAAGEKKLVFGMKDVWREAINHKGRLLVVEKNYMYAALHGGEEQVIYKADEPRNEFSYIKDAVDDVIEKVLENGGEVEFVDTDALRDYQHIALIEYY